MSPSGTSDCCKDNETTINQVGSLPWTPGKLNYAQKSLQPMKKSSAFLSNSTGLSETETTFQNKHTSNSPF